MVIWTKISQKIKILNLLIRNEKFLPIVFQIALNNYQLMILHIAKLQKIGFLGSLYNNQTNVSSQYLTNYVMNKTFKGTARNQVDNNLPGRKAIWIVKCSGALRTR